MKGVESNPQHKNRHNLSRLEKKIEKFVADRHWQKFHDTDTLSRALSIELIELALATKNNDRIAETSDVLSYLILLNGELQRDTHLENSVNQSKRRFDELAQEALECSKCILHAEHYDDYIKIAIRVEKLIRDLSMVLDTDLPIAALKKLNENSEKYPIDKVYGKSDKHNRCHATNILSQSNNLSPLEKAARQLEQHHWRATSEITALLKKKLVTEIENYQTGRFDANSLGNFQYKKLVDVLRKNAVDIPHIDKLTDISDIKENLIDVGLSAAHFFFQQDHKTLSEEILQEIVALDSDQLLTYFLAWHFGGSDLLAKLKNTYMSEEAIAFTQDLEIGRYEAAIEDLHSRPITDNGKPRLVIVISTDLRYLDLFTQLDDQPCFIGRIHDPKLALSLDQARVSLLPSRYSLLEHVVKQGKDTRTFYYEDMKIKISSERVFGPAIDTLFFIKTLRHFVNSHEWPPLERILELGAGSGALIYALASHLVEFSPHNRLHAIATDIFPEALAHSESLFVDLTNAESVVLTTLQDTKSLGQVQKIYGTESVDVLMVNPPYIPTTLLHQLVAAGQTLTTESLTTALDKWVLAAQPGLDVPKTTTEIAHRATEDLDLYVQALLEEGPRILKKQTGILFLLTSSTSEDVIRLMLKKSPLKAVRLGSRADVPLDVPEITSGVLRVKLLDLPGVNFDMTDIRYPLRHSLTALALFHPESMWDKRLSQ